MCVHGHTSCVCFMVFHGFMEASHLDPRNYTFFKYSESECEASHSKNNVFCRNYPYANSACVPVW